MRLETPRMLLRPFAPEDIGDLYAIFGDPEVMRYVEPAYSLKKTRDFLQDFCIERRPPGAFAAVERAGGRVIGYVLFKEMAAPGVYELGWLFNRAHWGRGYASEICTALVGHAFTALGAQRLCAETADSPASLAMMRKLGMRQEGVLRRHVLLHDGTWKDLHWCGLLREEYRP